MAKFNMREWYEGLTGRRYPASTDNPLNASYMLHKAERNMDARVAAERARTARQMSERLGEGNITRGRIDMNTPSERAYWMEAERLRQRAEHNMQGDDEWNDYTAHLRTPPPGVGGSVGEWVRHNEHPDILPESFGDEIIQLRSLPDKTLLASYQDAMRQWTSAGEAVPNNPYIRGFQAEFKRRGLQAPIADELSRLHEGPRGYIDPDWDIRKNKPGDIMTGIPDKVGPPPHGFLPAAIAGGGHFLDRFRAGFGIPGAEDVRQAATEGLQHPDESLITTLLRTIMPEAGSGEGMLQAILGMLGHPIDTAKGIGANIAQDPIGSAGYGAGLAAGTIGLPTKWARPGVRRLLGETRMGELTTPRTVEELGAMASQPETRVPWSEMNIPAEQAAAPMKTPLEQVHAVEPHAIDWTQAHRPTQGPAPISAEPSYGLKPPYPRIRNTSLPPHDAFAGAPVKPGVLPELRRGVPSQPGAEAFTEPELMTSAANRPHPLPGGQIGPSPTDAQRALIETHYPMVFNRARSITKNTQDAQDIAQEVATAAMHNVGDIKDLGAWMNTAATRKAIDRLHEAPREHLSLDVEVGETGQAVHEFIPSPLRGIVEGINDQEIANAARSEFSKLNDLDKQIVDKFFVEGKTMEETATELGLTVPGLNTRIYRFRPQLQAALQKFRQGGERAKRPKKSAVTVFRQKGTEAPRTFTVNPTPAKPKVDKKPFKVVHRPGTP